MGQYMFFNLLEWVGSLEPTLNSQFKFFDGMIITLIKNTLVDHNPLDFGELCL